jgi:DnaJ-class molecular chaperone
MIYFQNITKLEQAKLQYRTLAKQLHPDKGGSATQFNQMQQEYKTILLQLQQKQSHSIKYQPQKENDIMNELGKLAKVLIKKQVPQMFLQQRIQKSQSPLERGLFSQLVNFLDGINSNNKK